MSGLIEIRNRISSFSSTMQITNAMKMVSAAKLKKAQDSITATLPYSNKLSELIKNISASVDSDESSPLFEKRELKKPLLIVITSNKGLCGGFNSSIIKEIYSLASEYGSNTPDLLTIGKKGNDILRKKFNVISSHNEVYDNFSYSSVKEIAENITQRFESEEYDEIVLVYNHFKNAATQIITKEQFLPILDDSGDMSNVPGDYIFEPNRTKILEDPVGNLKLPNHIIVRSKHPITNDNNDSGKITKVLTPRNTPKVEPIKTGSTKRHAIWLQKKNTREANDANAKSGIRGTAIVIGKTADPAANKI